MFRRYGLVLLALLALAVPFQAQAAYKFGTDETIDRIEDVKLKGEDDEALFLGHMVRTHWFLAGLYVEDAGYVLGVQGDSKRFYRVPEGEELKRFQREGFLPDPLPAYSLSFFDYLFGYSLWLVVAGLGLWTLVSKLRAGRDEAEQATSSTPGPAA